MEQLQERACIQTNEEFVPQTGEHFFKDLDALEKYLNELDPAENYKERKSKVWSEMKKECKMCGNEFIAKHPATAYCDDCQQKRREEKISTERLVKICAECGKEFMANFPAQKYCDDCRKKKAVANG